MGSGMVGGGVDGGRDYVLRGGVTYRGLVQIGEFFFFVFSFIIILCW
jgi:hypothetical protein